MRQSQRKRERTEEHGKQTTKTTENKTERSLKMRDERTIEKEKGEE